MVVCDRPLNLGQIRFHLSGHERRHIYHHQLVICPTTYLHSASLTAAGPDLATDSGEETRTPFLFLLAKPPGGAQPNVKYSGFGRFLSQLGMQHVLSKNEPKAVHQTNSQPSWLTKGSAGVS